MPRVSQARTKQENVLAKEIGSLLDEKPDGWQRRVNALLRKWDRIEKGN